MPDSPASATGASGGGTRSEVDTRVSPVTSHNAAAKASTRFSSSRMRAFCFCFDMCLDSRITCWHWNQPIALTTLGDVEAKFKDRNIGGPSAGLVYSLLIADLLDPKDVARNRRIAASGTIQLDGTIGPVGGLHEKLVAAEEADADIFLVPQSELDDVTAPERRNRVTTVGVDDLPDALGILNGRG